MRYCFMRDKGLSTVLYCDGTFVVWSSTLVLYCIFGEIKRYDIFDIICDIVTDYNGHMCTRSTAIYWNHKLDENVK